MKLLQIKASHTNFLTPSHDDLRYLAYELRRQLVSEGHRVNERDYIARAQPGGYRALHLVIYSTAGIVELQLRTLLQSEWANTFEKLADKTGRRIRYESNYRPKDDELAKVADALGSIARILTIWSGYEQQGTGKGRRR